MLLKHGRTRSTTRITRLQNIRERRLAYDVILWSEKQNFGLIYDVASWSVEYKLDDPGFRRIVVTISDYSVDSALP